MGTSFIRDYPELVTVFISLLWGAVIVLGSLGYKAVMARIEKFQLELDSVKELVNAITKNYLTRFDGLSVKLDENKVTILERLHQLELKITKRR